MFLNIRRLFLMAVPDKVSLILSILKLLFAEPVLLRLPILILLGHPHKMFRFPSPDRPIFLEK